jgi:DNA-binding GntR family transcriptional regulator
MPGIGWSTLVSEPRGKTESATFQQQAYDYVREQIMSMGFRPGQTITDSQVAEALDISRTPAREALHRLQQEHLLTKQVRRGWKVSSLSVQDIHDIFEIKLLLEGLIARQAAACPDEDKRAALREAVVKMQRASEDRDFERWSEADTELHRLVFSMAPNRRLGQVIQGLNAQWYHMRVGLVALEGRVGRSNPEHTQIVEAILARDGDAAEGAMRAHLAKVRDELVRVLNMVLPFMVDSA